MNSKGRTHRLTLLYFGWLYFDVVNYDFTVIFLIATEIKHRQEIPTWRAC